MTALLFIPTTADARLDRRLDFARIASLFADRDEPPPPVRGNLARIGLLILILCGVIGDTMLVSHSDTVTNVMSTLHAGSDVRNGVSS